STTSNEDSPSRIHRCRSLSSSIARGPPDHPSAIGQPPGSVRPPTAATIHSLPRVMLSAPGAPCPRATVLSRPERPTRLGSTPVVEAAPAEDHAIRRTTRPRRRHKCARRTRLFVALTALARSQPALVEVPAPAP